MSGVELTMAEELFKIEFYVPPSHLEVVKEALFKAGAGKVGDYDMCCWQTLGQGQFKPGSESSPYQGALDQLEKIEEYKVELVCSAPELPLVVTALNKSHPYEEPAYSVIKLESL